MIHILLLQVVGFHLPLQIELRHVALLGPEREYPSLHTNVAVLPLKNLPSSALQDAS